MFRQQNIFRTKAQPLGKNLHKGVVEGQRAALKRNRRLNGQTLGQAADGLFGHGMKSGQRQIGPADPLVEQRLNIGFGIHAAAPRNVVYAAALGGQRIQLFNRHVQNRSDFIQKSAGAARTASVHPHIGGFKLAGGLVAAEENHFGVLPAQFNGGANPHIQRAQRQRVCHNLLGKGQPQRIGQLLGAGTGQNRLQPGTGKTPAQFPHRFRNAGGLIGMVAPII